MFLYVFLIEHICKIALNSAADDIKNVLQSKKTSMENRTQIGSETLFFGDLVDDGCQIPFFVDFGSIWGQFPEPKWSQSAKKKVQKMSDVQARR